MTLAKLVKVVDIVSNNRQLFYRVTKHQTLAVTDKTRLKNIYIFLTFCLFNSYFYAFNVIWRLNHLDIN